MSYSGYDIEDAVIVNKASLDWGYGRITQYRNYTTQFNINPNQIVDGLAAPSVNHNNNSKGSQSIRNQRALHVDGLARVGEKLYSGDIYVNKVVPAIT